MPRWIPLPPFLFVLVSVIDRNVGLNLDRRTVNARLNRVSFDRLYFADDTLFDYYKFLRGRQTFERNRRSVYAIRPPFEQKNVLLYGHEWE